MMQYMLNHLAVKVGDVTTATQMVRVVVELHLLVCIAFLEVVLRCSWHNTCLSSLQAAVIAAEALAVHIVVVVLAIVRHSKGCIIIINDLQLPCIFSFSNQYTSRQFHYLHTEWEPFQKYLSYFTDGFNRSCNECIKASLAVKVSSFAFTTS